MIQHIFKIYAPKDMGTETHQRIIGRIVNDFEGYTQYDTKGVWGKFSEAVVVYEVISTDAKINIFHSIMEDMYDAGELSVLITHDTITTL